MPQFSSTSGAELAGGQSAGSPNEAPPRTGAIRQFVDNRWVVLATMFFVTGALGLPMLWASRGFSPVAKAWLTLAVLAYTAFLLWLFYLVMAWVVPTVAEAWRNL